MIAKIFIKKELHKSYLNFLFEKDQNQNYKVTRLTDFGKLLTSLVRYSKTPVTTLKRQPNAIFTSFVLPASRPLANAGNYYLYFTAEDQEKINDYLDAIFNIDFDRYYLNGKRTELQQQEIIQTFILSRKLTQYIGDNETLKKRHYREDIKLLKKYTDLLITKAYDRNNRIKEAGNLTNRLTVK